MITYIKGDATQPIGEGKKFIVHCCNDIGAWGAGFVLALSQRWPAPEMIYRMWYANRFRTRTFKLGQISKVHVTPDITVINLIGQSGIRSALNKAPIVYPAIREGLQRVATLAKAQQASIHMPRIGCGLGGGDWDLMEKIINEELKDIAVTIYDI